MKRRNIIVVGVVAVLLISGIAFFFFSKKTATPSNGGIPVFPQGGVATTPGGASAASQAPGQGIVFVPGSGSPIPRLYELHKAPVAGVGFYETGKGSTLSIKARYMERSLGNIFETSLDTLTETRISNETHPQVAEALWGNSGNSVIFRYLDDQIDGLIKTHILNLSAGQTQTTVGTSTESAQPAFLKTEEVSLPDYIPFIATAGDNNYNLFYLKDTGDSIIGSLTDYRNKLSSSIFGSSFTEWLPQFPNKNLVTLNTKPSAVVPGYLFFLDTKTKALTKILGGLNGLTTLTNTDGKLVLYSQTQNGVPQLSVFNTSKKQSEQIPLETLPDKCVWSALQKTVVYCAVPQSLPGGTYPDQWYQGILSFSDSLWEVDTAKQTTTKIMVPGNLGAPALDMTNLSLSSDDSYLLFINKVTSTPWMYRLSLAQPTIASNSPSAQGVSTVLPSAITPDMQKIR